MTRIVQQSGWPHSGVDVAARTQRLASALRAAGGLVVWVRSERPEVPEQPPGSALAATLIRAPGDLQIVKTTWGAFHATTLHQDLQRHGVTTLWLAGITTNHSVESTARCADQLGYDVVFIDDAMTGSSPGEHEFAVTRIFPLLGTVTATEPVLTATPIAGQASGGGTPPSVPRDP